MKLPHLTPVRAGAASLAFLVAWPVAAVMAAHYGWNDVASRVRFWGWISTYLLGLVWAVWGVERLAQRYEDLRRSPFAKRNRIWNPLDAHAWYYGRSGKRLHQSLLVWAVYSVMFLLVLFLLKPRVSDIDPFELPAGGGQDIAFQKQQIRIVKPKKKYVINPYSSILFNPPPIEMIDTKLVEVSQHQYAVGQGSGTGAGFGAGTSKGKIRLPRLKHSDRAWDRNFGINGDLNMLIQYNLRTKHNVAEKTEVIECAQIARLTPTTAPPLVLVTGAAKFEPSAQEQRILKQYLTDKHGMILADNLGGPGFHNSFVAAMNAITGTQPVPIPRDDYIHVRPFKLPDLPIVVAHGGTRALGWKLDGRWVAYYHPGAITDAWRDDHAGIKSDIWEDCYLLGCNILFYAAAEKSKWLEAQKP